MKMIPVNEIPKGTRSSRSDIHALIKAFIESDCEKVRIDFDSNDYKSPLVAYKCIGVIIKRPEYSAVSVIRRGENIYLVKKNGGNT